MNRMSRTSITAMSWSTLLSGACRNSLIVSLNRVTHLNKWGIPNEVELSGARGHLHNQRLMQKSSWLRQFGRTEALVFNEIREVLIVARSKKECFGRSSLGQDHHMGFEHNVIYSIMLRPAGISGAIDTPLTRSFTRMKTPSMNSARLGERWRSVCGVPSSSAWRETRMGITLSSKLGRFACTAGGQSTATAASPRTV